jgi:hypothetical protein
LARDRRGYCKRHNDPVNAFRVLISRDGAGSFRDIGRYTEYAESFGRIRVAYPTTFGTARVTLKPQGASRISFHGTGPFGVSFQGAWTRNGNVITLDQTVQGIPSFATGLVHKKVRRALDDLARV